MRSLVAMSPNCSNWLFITVIMNVNLVSVVEECLSYGQALQGYINQVHKMMIDWEIITLTMYIYKGKTKEKTRVGRFGREIMEDACMICSQALFK
jgi:hypothetical protein